MECNIEVYIQDKQNNFQSSMTRFKTAGHHLLPKSFIKVLEQQFELWSELNHALNGNELPVLEGDIETETIDGDEFLHFMLFCGSEGFDIAPILARLFHACGCEQVHVIIYHDECEYITDDEGEDHAVGLCYYFDEGKLASKRYPEVEYHYI